MRLDIGESSKGMGSTSPPLPVLGRR